MMKDNFPSGATLIAELIDLHKTTEDESTIQLIETEMATALCQMVEVAEPTDFRLSDYSVSDLRDFHEMARSKRAKRRIRLRLFEKLGTFDGEWEERTHEDTPDGVLEALTVEEIHYLSHSVDSYLIERCASQELSRRSRSLMERVMDSEIERE